MKNLYIFFTLALFLFSSEIKSQACSGTPASNSAVASSTNLCPGNTVTLSLLNTYTTTGLLYQWAYSTSSQFGPWTPINGANNTTLITNTLNVSGYYTAVIVCTAALASNTATPVYLNFGSVSSTSTVPFYEGFNVSTNNILPNCSWSASSLGTNCLTFSTGVSMSGSGFGAFAYSLTALGTHAFYSMGIQLNAGVVYSTSIWQTTNTFSNQNQWSVFGISVGPNQSATGMTTVAQTSNPAVGQYSNVSGTFSVASSGIYYMRIFATSVSGSNAAPRLNFDDFSVTIPCTIAANAASAVVSPSVVNVCQGDSVLLTITPGLNTSTGITGNTLYVSPFTNTVLNFSLQNSLTSCVNTLTLQAFVNPNPNIVGTPSPQAICEGMSSQISNIFGGPSAVYTLQPGNITGNSFLVTPSVTTNYTLSLLNNFGCLSTSSLNIVVKNNPTITLIPSSATVCAGETFDVQGQGAVIYLSGANMFGANITLAAATSSQTFVIVGSAANSCTSSATFVEEVQTCLGLTENEFNSQSKVYPNPGSGLFLLECDDALQLQVFDLKGNLILLKEVQSNATMIDMRGISPGIYFLRINRLNAIDHMKVIVE